jgi:hypothetical protein
MSSLFALGLATGCQPAPDADSATVEQADQAPLGQPGQTAFLISVDSQTVIETPDNSPNHYHTAILVAGADTSSGAPQLLWPQPVVYDGLFADNVGSPILDFVGGPFGTFRNDDASGHPVFKVGPVPVLANSNQRVRIVLLGDDDSDNSRYSGPHVNWGTWADGHAFAMQQANDVVKKVGDGNPSFNLWWPTVVLPDPNVGASTRPCAGPYMTVAVEKTGAELLALTDNPQQSGTFSDDNIVSGPWPEECGDIRPETKYTIRVDRIDAPFPSLGATTCTPKNLVPFDGASPKAWSNTWADAQYIAHGAIDVSIGQSFPGYQVDTNERVIASLGKTTTVSESATKTFPHTEYIGDYTKDVYPPPAIKCLPGFPCASAPAPAPPPPPSSGSSWASGVLAYYHDTIDLPGQVRLELYHGVCAENGYPIRRLRYVRTSTSGSLLDDVMLQPASKVPY